jgi:SAM-dependent methyltransferase
MVTTNSVHVDPSNIEQLRAWDGDEGAYWAAHDDYFDRAMVEHHERLLSTAAIAPFERVIDIGCGTGQTTRDAARAASHASALGVELSAVMLAVARQRTAAEGVGNASFLQADAQIYAFDPEAFDIAISRTGTMFFGDRIAAFTNIGRSLVPGGRLVMVVWQHAAANEWLREIMGALSAGRKPSTLPPDAPGPFSLSEPSAVRSVLSSAGFTDIDLDALEAPMWFGDDADDAHLFLTGMLGWMLEGLDETGRRRASDDLRTTLAAHASSDGVVFGSAAWVIRAARR